MNMLRSLMLVSAMWLLSGGARAISLGQNDDFQDGSVQGWQGAPKPNGPVNIGTGGPFGDGDKFIRITSVGGFGPGANLALYNTDQWSGNYTAAGVKAIEVHLKNFSSQPVHMRVVVFGTFGSRWTSLQPVVLPVNSGWVRVFFSLKESDLVRVLGSETYGDTIANVTRLMIRHDADPAGSGGDPIVGELGVDNVTASAGPTVFPNSMSVTQGTLRAGIIQDLFFSDDRLVRIEEAPGSIAAEVIVEGVSTLASVTALRVGLETSVSALPSNAVVQNLYLFNFGSGQYELADSRDATGSDNSIVVTPSGDPNRFVQSGTKLVRAKISWVDKGILFFPAWQAKVDRLVWLTEG